MSLSRRNFFLRILQSITVLSIPAAFGTFLESCAKQDNPVGNSSTSALAQVQGNNSGSVVSITIDSSSPLAKTGGTAIINSSLGQILVDRASDTQFNAFTAICTHAGCTVSNFDSSNNQFVCPCHGSRYDLNGKVVQGPAPSSLQAYQASFSNNVLKITV